MSHRAVTFAHITEISWRIGLNPNVVAIASSLLQKHSNLRYVYMFINTADTTYWMGM